MDNRAELIRDIKQIVEQFKTERPTYDSINVLTRKEVAVLVPQSDTRFSDQRTTQPSSDPPLLHARGILLRR